MEKFQISEEEEKFSISKSLLLALNLLAIELMHSHWRKLVLTTIIFFAVRLLNWGCYHQMCRFHLVYSIAYMQIIHYKNTSHFFPRKFYTFSAFNPLAPKLIWPNEIKFQCVFLNKEGIKNTPRNIPINIFINNKDN